jgi:hypothetical protein
LATPPVKQTFAMDGAAQMAAPVGPEPWITRSTPSGRPASAKTLANRSPIRGVYSEGFNTTPLPATSAMPTGPAGTSSG